MIVLCVANSQVFIELGKGTEVYAIEPTENKLINLKYEPVYVVMELVKNAASDYAFFKVESEVY